MHFPGGSKLFKRKIAHKFLVFNFISRIFRGGLSVSSKTAGKVIPALLMKV